MEFSLTVFHSRSFATVGMFSAVTNLGAGGIQDVALSDTANGVLYGTFALTGLISGGINNGSFAFDRPSTSPNIVLITRLILVLGPRHTLFIVSLVILPRATPDQICEYRALLVMRSTSALSGRTWRILTTSFLCSQFFPIKSSDSGYSLVLDFCWCNPGCDRSFALVCPGVYHDELPSREG